MTVAAADLYAEITYLAYHFHWSLEAILDLEHPLRRRFVAGISQLEQRRPAGR